MLPRETRSRALRSRYVAVAVTAAMILILWFLISTPRSNVRNIGSSGSAIIALGDSLTAGYGAPAGEDYPTVLSSLIGAVVINAGRSGDTTKSVLGRLDPDVLSKDPRIVIVGLGGNDFLRGVPPSATEGNLRMIIRNIQSHGAMVVLLGFEFPGLGTDYGSMYERVADEEGCLLVSDVLDGILSKPSLKSDEIHPNGEGYRLMAQRIAGPMKGLLRKAEAQR